MSPYEFPRQTTEEELKRKGATVKEVEIKITNLMLENNEGATIVKKEKLVETEERNTFLHLPNNPLILSENRPPQSPECPQKKSVKTPDTSNSRNTLHSQGIQPVALEWSYPDDLLERDYTKEITKTTPSIPLECPTKPNIGRPIALGLGLSSEIKRATPQRSPSPKAPPQRPARGLSMAEAIGYMHGKCNIQPSSAGDSLVQGGGTSAPALACPSLPSEAEEITGAAHARSTVIPGLGGGEAEASSADDPYATPTTPQRPMAGITFDNRNFICVRLSGRTYRALLDPGATVSIVGPIIAERFRDRITPSASAIKSPLGMASRPLGDLRINLEVDGHCENLTFRALRAFEQDMILGMDFCLKWEVDVSHAKRIWRTKEGMWHEFQNDANNKEEIFAECAGISEIAEDQKERIEELVEKYIPRAQDDPEKLGTTMLVEHHIDVQGATPIKEKLRRMSPMMLEVARAEVAKMHTADVIEPSASEWCSAPVIIKKSDGSYRFCVDYRPVNRVTRKDAYPIPRVDDTLDKLRKARYISTIDLKSAYYQIRMEEGSKQYTAFAVPGSGLWQFKRMPFGLTNAPMTFQRLIDALFGPEVEPYVFGYLDDIIIVTETFEEHVRWLEFVLNRLGEAGLSINRDKCDFCCASVKYLGFILDCEGLRPDPEKVAPVLSYPAPRNVKQLRRFLGMLGWYSRFIEHDSELKVPLLKLLKKAQDWQWSDEQQESFEKLKVALTTAPVLARPDFSKMFTIQCDASNFAVGAVLTQELEDGEHPIVYVSRVLSPAEKNYTTTEKECLALLWAIKKLRPYLEGYEFRAITDHSALRWLQNLKEPTGRLARWAIEMQQWDMEIVHRKGALNHLPDALSRMFEDDEIEVAAFEVIEDEWYTRRVREVSETPFKFQSWKVEDGLLYKYRKDPLLDPIVTPEEGWRLVVPANHRASVLSEAHRAPSSGHLGIEKTYDRIAREYYWPGVWHEVHAYVTSCPECQAYKTSQQPPQGLMGKRIVEQPWTVVAADLMEFPPSKSQFKYVIVFMDLFTKWIEMKPLRKADGKAVVRAFEELILFRWETPRYFLTDNGKEFANKFLASTLEEYGVMHTTTPPYHPQSNPVERSNRTLKTMIASYVKSNHRDWDTHLHEFRHAINTATQASTKVSPAFLNFGRQPTPVKSNVANKSQETILQDTFSIFSKRYQGERQE